MTIFGLYICEWVKYHAGFSFSYLLLRRTKVRQEMSWKGLGDELL